MLAYLVLPKLTGCGSLSSTVGWSGRINLRVLQVDFQRKGILRKHQRGRAHHYQPRGAGMFSRMGHVHGGPISATSRYMAYLCPGGLNLMPGNGRRVRINSVGMYLARPYGELSLTCSRECRGPPGQDMLP